MINKVRINYGDLFLVDFDPSVGHEFQGQRPALVIESDQQINKTNLVTVLPLTSNLNNKTADDILIKVDDSNKLHLDSVVKVYNIISFDHSRFINKIGRVNDNVQADVKKYLKKHFGL